MWTFRFIQGSLALAMLSQAFPSSGIPSAHKATDDFKHDIESLLKRQNGDAPTFPGIVEGFSELQLIDVTGEHAFVPPGPNDLRGPCPGLNALANHGYLPHNGYATLVELTLAMVSVVGMGAELTAFLSAYGSAIDGDGLAFSIGGTPPVSIGSGNGLSGSHNKYESDASPTRPDLYQDGNNYRLKIDQFQDLIDTQPDPETANYNIEVLTDFRKKRFDHQVATNPYFFNGPFAGLLVQPAAYTFIYRFMANHSAEYPVGTLNQDVLKSWFAITGESGNYQWNEGHERIPNNWYRRSLVVMYEVEYLLLDVLYGALKYPEFLSVGGNTGTTNSFTGIDVANLTRGVYNAEDLTQGDKFACFAYQVAAQASPDILLAGKTNLLNALSPILTKLNCPQLTEIDESLLEQFPGYKR